MKRVLIITYYWPPSGGAGVQRWLKFAKYLPGFDWEPVILTVDPGYASYPVIDPSLEKEINPDLKIIRTRSKEFFSMYKKVSNTTNIPFAGFANEKKGSSLKQFIAKFIRGNFFLPDPRKGWNKFALNAARELIRTTNIDAIITSSPPHSTQLIGRALAREFDLPWVADLRDPWTDIYFYREFYPTFFADRYNRKCEKRVLEGAARVITVGTSLQNVFKNKLQQNKNKVQVIHNGFDPDDFSHIVPSDESKFTITYVGTLAESYPLIAFLKAAGKLMAENQEVLLKFIGTISPEYASQISALPQNQAIIIPYVDHNEAIQYMSEADVLLLVIPSHYSSKSILTGKLFEYMAVQKPILNLGPVDGDAADIIRQCSAGITLEADQTEEIYNLLKQWSQKLPEVKANSAYSRKTLSGKLAGLLDSLQS